MKKAKTFRGIRFIPSQDKVDGRFNNYTIYCSNDKSNWGQVKGTVNWWGATNKMPKEMWFKTPSTYRYIRFITSHIQQDFISLAEIDIIE